MSEDRDPFIETLFADAEEALPPDGLAASIMAAIAARQRRLLIGRLTVVALLMLLELVLDSPLQNSVGVLTDALATNLFEFEGEWLTFVLSPINSVAGLLGLLLLGLGALYRRL